MYLFSALYNASNHDLLVWFVIFAIAALFRAIVLLTKIRFNRVHISPSPCPHRHHQCHLTFKILMIPKHVPLALQESTAPNRSRSVFVTLLCTVCLTLLFNGVFAYICYDLFSEAGLPAMMIMMFDVRSEMGMGWGWRSYGHIVLMCVYVCVAIRHVCTWMPRRSDLYNASVGST